MCKGAAVPGHSAYGNWPSWAPTLLTYGHPNMTGSKPNPWPCPHCCYSSPISVNGKPRFQLLWTRTSGICPGSPGQMPEVLESYGMLCDGCVRNGELGGGAGNKADCFGPCEPCCGSWPFSFGGSKEPAEGLTTGQ